MKSAIIYNGGSFFFDLDREAFESSGAFDRSLYLMGIGACFDGGRFASVSRLFGQQTLRKGPPLGAGERAWSHSLGEQL